MRKILLVIICVVASSLSLLAQVPYEGTLNLRDGTKLTGTITVFSPENGYSATFYRIDVGTETRYLSADDVLPSDDKHKLVEKNEVPDNNNGKVKTKVSRKEKKSYILVDNALPERRNGICAKFMFVGNNLGVALSYDITERRHRAEFGLGWDRWNTMESVLYKGKNYNINVNCHIICVSASYDGYWRLFKGMHLYLGPSLGMGVGIIKDIKYNYFGGSYFSMVPGVDSGLEYDFNRIPLGINLGFEPHWNIMFGSGASGFAFNMNVGIKYLF